MWRNSQPLNGTLLFTDDPYYEIIEIENYKEGRATIYFKNNQKFTGNFRNKNRHCLTFYYVSQWPRDNYFPFLLG